MSEETNDKRSDKEKSTEKRCFVMMPFSDQGDYPKEHFTKVYEQIFKPAIIDAGYTPYRVDENTISDSIISKIFEGVQNCEMALCDLSNRNPNVLYELGLRQAYNKPVVLVKDEKTENIFDVAVISTVPYNSNRLYENVLEAQEKICESLKSTGEGKDTTLLQFVRAKEASYDDVKFNKDDTVNIMLQSIMKELQRLNSSTEIGNKESNFVKVYIYAKRSITQGDLLEVMEVLEDMTNAYIKVEISQEDEYIIFTIPQSKYNTYQNEIKKIIKERLGRISIIKR